MKKSLLVAAAVLGSLALVMLVTFADAAKVSAAGDDKKLVAALDT